MMEAERTEEFTPRIKRADDYSEWLLRSHVEILSVLRALIRSKTLVTLHLDRGASILITSLLALVDDDRDLVLDVGHGEDANRLALQAREIELAAVVDKVRVQFGVSRLALISFEGRPAFRAAVPDRLLRLQRREFFRLAPPIANPIKLGASIRREGRSPLQLEIPLLDISGGGAGLMVPPAHEEHFAPGKTLDACRIALPGEGLLVTPLCVRNVFRGATRSGARFVRVGVQFVNLSALKLTMLQRYITRVERERKARLSGIA